MGCFLVLNSFEGNDQEAAAKKLALMFRISPQNAGVIMKKVAKGQEWRTPREISDQQAAVAEKYLQGIGFQVEKTGHRAVANQTAGAVAVADEPPNNDVGLGYEEDGDPMDEGSPGQLRTGSDAGPPGGNGGTNNPGGPPPQDIPIGFHGSGGGLFKIMLVNWILTVLTLGIYSFWGKTKVRRYLCEQSSFAGDRFHYHGTGAELFKGALIFGAMFGLFNLGIYSVGQVWGMEARGIAQSVGGLLIIFLLPVIMVGAFRYRLSRTAWRGIRFSFRGKRKSALWLYIKGYIFMILTFYLYWPFFMVKIQKFWRSGSYFGSQSFSYDGKGKDIFRTFLLMVLLFVLTLSIPIALPLWFPEIGQGLAGNASIVFWIPFVIGFLWFTVYLDRYHWSKTQFAEGRFNYDATTVQWFWLNFTNFLIIVLTAGFGIPFATARSRQFLADHLAVVGNMQLSQVVQEAQKSSALGEGAADGFDMDIDIGI
jgi:uncharacterized membrane protein YjgN (DUF898 family)